MEFFIYNKPMNLIDTFENPDKVIETIISKIFFYGKKVLKVYKYERFFFGNFGDPKFRQDFYKEDFYWNNLMAPDIYRALREVKDDFFIEMRKFDDNKNLTNLLLKKNVSEKDIKLIAAEMVLRLKKLTFDKKDRYKSYFKRKLSDSHKEDLESDKNLLYMISELVPKEKIDAIIGAAKNASDKNSYFEGYNSRKLSLLIDNHADNIIFSDGKVEFIDVLPPKESWRVGDLNFVICRLATDAAVLGNEELADAVYGSCESMPEKIKHIYEIRSALIQTWCFYSVKKPEIAENYLKFAEERARGLTCGLT